MRNTYSVFIAKLEWKRLLEIRRYSWGNNIEIDL
jgi:hypothetical protein